MASGRMLQRKISTSHDLIALIERVNAEMGKEHGAYAALLFTWCIAHQDVAGRMHGDARLVRAAVIPLIEHITTELVEAYIGHMAAIGIVLWYEVDGRRYLEFPSFEANQPGIRKDREPASTFPASNQGLPVTAGKLPANIRQTAGNVPAEVEEKRSRSRKEVELAADKPPPLPFTVDQAQGYLAEAGRFVRVKLTQGQAINAQRLIRDNPDPAAWKLVGQWLAAGGESWRQTVDGRALGDFAAWLAHAQKWDADGRPLVLQSAGGAHAPGRGNTVGHAKPAPANTETREHEL